MIVLRTAAVLRGVQTSKQDDVPDQLKVRLPFPLLPTRIGAGTNCPSLSLALSYNIEKL